MLDVQWRFHWVKVQMEQAFRAQLMAYWIHLAWDAPAWVMFWKYTAVLRHLSYEVKLTPWSTGQLNWWRHSGRPIAIVQTAVDEPRLALSPGYSNWTGLCGGHCQSLPTTIVYQQSAALKQQCQRSSQQVLTIFTWWMELDYGYPQTKEIHNVDIHKITKSTKNQWQA